MQLSELFRRLSYGELVNLAVSGEGSGEILPAAHPRFISYTNEALLRLHGRFVLREDDLIIQQVEHITRYPLLKKYAVSNVASTEPHKFIKDWANKPFQEDVIKVNGAFSDCGEELPLNDEEECTSVFTPSPTVLQVPCPVAGRYITLTYQARHPEIATDDDLTAEIEIPYVLEGALTAYIAYKAYSFMNTQESTAKAAEHLGQYEMICSGVIDRDLLNSSPSTSNKKFSKRGFR
jgi:hypothetical protein